MKKIILSISFALISILSFSTKPHIANVMVNTQNSTIKWTGSKLSSSHDGNINIQKGVLMIDHGTLVGGQFSINMNSITCNDIKSVDKNEYFVSHLKNEDFFNVEKFPSSTITIVSATKSEGNIYKIIADLTIMGITNSVAFNADVDINGPNFLATAKIKIDRTRWGIKYKSGNFFKDLGDKIILDEIEFDIYLLSAK